GILALAENQHIGHARNALERIPDVNVQVVAHEQGGIFVVIRRDRSAKDEVLRALRRSYADRLHRRRQTPLSGIDSVLDVDCCQVRIAVQIKSRSDVARAIVAAGGGHVFHSLRAIDLLLQRDGHGAFHGLRAGPDVSTGYAYLRRRQVGKLRDRQGGNDGSAPQNYQQSTNRGEHRTTYKEFNEHRNPKRPNTRNVYSACSGNFKKRLPLPGSRLRARLPKPDAGGQTAIFSLVESPVLHPAGTEFRIR